MLVFSL